MSMVVKVVVEVDGIAIRSEVVVVAVVVELVTLALIVLV